jgi:3-oxoadipate enol-lactonase
MVAAGLGAAAAGARGRGRAPSGQAHLPGRIVDAAGIRMHYIERGQGDAIVLIHGLGGTSASWAGVIPLLAANHRVIAVDLAGFGFSGSDPGLLLTQGRQAERVGALMDALGLGRATVVGHSLGGAVAQRLAASSPAKVERLVLVASVDAGGEKVWAPESLGRRAVRRLGHPGALLSPSAARGAARSLLRPSRAPEARVRNAASFEQPLNQHRILAPTLVISGTVDTVVSPATGEAIAARIPGARHVVLKGAGHLIPEECPEALVEELLAFAHEADSGSA